MQLGWQCLTLNVPCCVNSDRLVQPCPAVAYSVWQSELRTASGGQLQCSDVTGSCSDGSTTQGLAGDMSSQQGYLS